MIIEADPVCRNCGKTMRSVAEIAPQPQTASASEPFGVSAAVFQAVC